LSQIFCEPFHHIHPVRFKGKPKRDKAHGDDDSRSKIEGQIAHDYVSGIGPTWIVVDNNDHEYKRRDVNNEGQNALAIKSIVLKIDHFLTISAE